MKKKSNSQKFNLVPFKKLLYGLQVIVIAVTIPVLCVIEMSHNIKMPEPVEQSAHSQYLSTGTVKSSI